MKPRAQLFGKTLFTDFLMSNLAVLLGLMMLSDVSHRRKQAQEAGLRTEGAYAVIMDWPNDSPDDVDLYARDPSGNIIYFNSRDLGLMHLEHDDQGAASDKAKLGSGEVRVEKNEERIILRGIVPGEYVINVQMYDKRSAPATPVTIRLVRLKGEDVELAKKERVLKRSGDEATAFRFTLNADGTVGGVNELERSLASGGSSSEPSRSIFPFNGGP